MKTLLLTLISLHSALASAAEVYTCKSKDFNPRTSTGQSLQVTVTRGQVTEIRKNKGSWYSDTGVVVNPRVLSKTMQATVYQCDFRDDSSNGRLVVVGMGPLQSAKYSFYDYESGKAEYSLTCTFKR